MAVQKIMFWHRGPDQDSAESPAPDRRQTVHWPRTLPFGLQPCTLPHETSSLSHRASESSDRSTSSHNRAATRFENRSHYRVHRRKSISCARVPAVDRRSWTPRLRLGPNHQLIRFATTMIRACPIVPVGWCQYGNIAVPF
jgi:hypothetical protein